MGRYTPGRRFKNGKWYEFTADTVTVVRAWPPAGWERTGTGPWKHIRPELDLPDVLAHARTLARLAIEPPPPFVLPCGQQLLPFDRPEPQVYRDAAAKAATFVDAIPEEIRALVCSFPTGYYALLSFFARCPGAVELGRSCPALAFALAHGNSFRSVPVQRPLRSARALLLKPRTTAAAWLGFAKSRAVVRMLGRVHLADINIGLLTRLRDLTHSKRGLQRLGHLPVVSDLVVRLLTVPRFHRWFSPRLLRQVALFHGDGAAVLRDLAQAAQVIAPDGQPPEQPLADLERVRVLAKAFAPPELGADFPAPPYPATESLTPICTAAELRREGHQMSHCVASYISAVEEGECYIYRLNSPERCTVEVVRQVVGWKLGQVKGFANARPAPKTMAHIKKQLTWVGS